ncbi:MAG: hypothetical protein ACHQ4J_01915 [Candidatus Binatia bacterium]
MSPDVDALLTELRHLGARLQAKGDRLVIDAPKGALTPELRRTLSARKPELLRLVGTHQSEEGDLTSGSVTGVLIRSAVLDGALLWLVADDDTLAEHPDILRSGHAVFFFDEVERLRGKTAAELRAIAMVKAVFPTGRVLQ